MEYHIGKKERVTQDRVVRLFKEELGYQYLGNWEDGLRSQPIEEDLLLEYLLDEKRGYSRTQATRAIHKMLQASTNLSEGLYTANKKVYEMLRYGVTIREEAGKPKETVWLIDWKDPDNNNFAVAEEVTVKGKNSKRPDVVLYLNGIAVGVLELKRSKVGLTQGIRQNLD
ncbi:MAG: type I restriction endonuclease, partial [Arenibacter sp.]